MEGWKNGKMEELNEGAIPTFQHSNIPIIFDMYNKK